MTSLILFLDNESHFLIVESLIHRCMDVILLDILLSLLLTVFEIDMRELLFLVQKLIPELLFNIMPSELTLVFSPWLPQ